jgi:hypothetical protein
VQCSCKNKLSADGHAEVHASSDEESEAEETKEEEEGRSKDGLVTERKEAGSAEMGGAGRERGCMWVQVQFRKQPRLEAGGLG